MIDYSKIVDWITLYCEEYKIKTLVVGVSGGIDSAVTSTLAAETGFKTIVLTLPIHQNQNQVNLANSHIDWLKAKYSNVTHVNFDLTSTYEAFKATVNPYVNSLTLANTRARLRMTSLYQIAGMYDGIVVGTGNKVEDFGVGFYTKYGDGGVDISPIADLMKSEVYEVGRNLGIIEGIMKAAPTDGLWEDSRTDETQIGASYDELEWAMTFSGDKSNLSKRELEVLEIYLNLNKKNKHKMDPIPVYIKS